MQLELMISGAIIGVMEWIATIVLVEKAPLYLQRIIFKHYLASDILFTVMATIVLPVTGYATLFGALVYMILTSMYLGYRRNRVYGPRGE